MVSTHQSDALKPVARTVKARAARSGCRSTQRVYSAMSVVSEANGLGKQRVSHFPSHAVHLIPHSTLSCPVPCCRRHPYSTLSCPVPRCRRHTGNTKYSFRIHMASARAVCDRLKWCASRCGAHRSSSCSYEDDPEVWNGTVRYTQCHVISPRRVS